MVTRMWRGPGSQVVSNSSHVTVSNLLKRLTFVYETTIEFDLLSTTDSGNYECEATVTPDTQSQFVIMSTTGSDTHTVTVQGEYCNYHFWSCGLNYMRSQNVEDNSLYPPNFTNNIRSCNALTCKHVRIVMHGFLPQLFLSQMSSSLLPPLQWLGSHTPLPALSR